MSRTQPWYRKHSRPRRVHAFDRNLNELLLIYRA